MTRDDSDGSCNAADEASTMSAEFMPRRPAHRWPVELRRVAQTLVIPQGFTLSIAGTLALVVGQRGSPGLVGIWVFVLSAGAGLCLVSVLSGAVSRGSQAPHALAGLALLNLTPAVVIPITAAGIWWVPGRTVAFGLAGGLAVVSYVSLAAAFFAVFAPRPAPPR